MFYHNEEGSLNEVSNGRYKLLFVLGEELADCGVLLVVVLNSEHEHSDESGEIKDKT